MTSDRAPSTDPPDLSGITALVVGLALCFTLAWLAERIGLADIVGAFAAGLLLDPYGRGVRSREDEASLAELFVPLFFILMGLQVQLGTVASSSMLLLALAISACAVAGKVAAGVGVVQRGVNRLSVGIGMVPRGEVGLIFAGLGATLTLEGQPLHSEGVFYGAALVHEPRPAERDNNVDAGSHGQQTARGFGAPAPGRVLR